MSEWKEVWYVWDGEGSKLENGVYVRAGNAIYLDYADGDYDLVAYTLGEQRRRCAVCDGKGKWKENPWFTRKCNTCNGTGWEYKK